MIRGKCIFVDILEVTAPLGENFCLFVCFCWYSVKWYFASFPADTSEPLFLCFASTLGRRRRKGAAAVKDWRPPACRAVLWGPGVSRAPQYRPQYRRRFPPYHVGQTFDRRLRVFPSQQNAGKPAPGTFSGNLTPPSFLCLLFLLPLPIPASEIKPLLLASMLTLLNPSRLVCSLETGPSISFLKASTHMSLEPCLYPGTLVDKVQSQVYRKNDRHKVGTGEGV